MGHMSKINVAQKVLKNILFLEFLTFRQFLTAYNQPSNEAKNRAYAKILL